jgi:hypothetical protein
MSNKNARGLKNDPNESTDRPQGQRRDVSADDDVVDEKRDQAGARKPLGEYRFSEGNNVRQHSSASADVVDEVYHAILDRLDGQSECYVKTSYLDIDQPARAVGHAVGELAYADDCPLDIEEWSDSGTRTHTWHVTVLDDPELDDEIPECPWCGEPGAVEDRDDDLYVREADDCVLDSYQVSPDKTVVTDGGVEGAIDNEFDEAERTAREQLEAARPDTPTEPVEGGIAFDLVTRQPLFVRRVVAPTLVEYYEREEFDLLNYDTHPYLPVSIDDRVFECVFISDITAESLSGFSSEKTYDYPKGRLAHVPVEQAWTSGGDE